MGVGLLCCCCPFVGLDQESWTAATNCCRDLVYVPNVHEDLDLLDDLQLILCGPISRCDRKINFAEDQFEELADWVRDGNKLFVAGESQGCWVQEDFDKFNLLMEVLGVSMRIGNDLFCTGCQTPVGHYINTDLGVSEGITAMHAALVNTISGGSHWVAKTRTPDPVPEAPCPEGEIFIAAERCEDGIVFASGDSNIFQINTFSCGCDPGNQTFLNNLFFIPPDELL